MKLSYKAKFQQLQHPYYCSCISGPPTEEYQCTMFVICRWEPSGPTSWVPSSGGALAGRGHHLWAEQTGGTCRAAEQMWPGDSVSAWGSQRSVCVFVLLLCRVGVSCTSDPVKALVSNVLINLASFGKWVECNQRHDLLRHTVQRRSSVYHMNILVANGESLIRCYIQVFPEKRI